MIKLKDLLFESTAPDIFVPRRVEDRLERMIKDYIRNGSKESLELSNMNLIELPAILKNVTVGRNFYCNFNKLTSLINSPSIVVGSFYCGSNRLISLKGAPKSVGRDFFCGVNNLTSLDGAPTYVGGSFSCGNNSVQFTEEQVRAVCDVKKKVYV